MNRQATKKRERERTPNNRTTTGFRISDELWAQLQPLLPVHENTHRGWREDAHECPIATVRMPSSTCCEPAASGKPWIKPSCVRTRRPMIAFKSGCRPQSSSSCGRPVEGKNTKFRRGSSGCPWSFRMCFSGRFM